MLCKSLIAKPTVGLNSDLHKCLAFVHVRVTEMAKPIICYPVTSEYSLIRDCACCICLVWSALKVVIIVNSPSADCLERVL